MEEEAGQKFEEAKDAVRCSLDEYIRKRKMSDQFALLNLRKYSDKNVSKDFLDKSLDAFVKAAEIKKPEAPVTSSCGRFDRRSLKDDSGDESEDEPSGAKIIDSDVEMEIQPKLPNIVEENEKEIYDLDDILHFQTIESKNGIRVRSQQWRIEESNLIDRPEGVKRLEFLPLSEEERYKRHSFKSGKIKKYYKSSTTSSMTSLASQDSEVLAQGTFVEKGSFTYKFGDRNRDGGENGIIGIERAKQVPATRVPTQPAGAQPVNINMDWGGFFNEFNQCIDKIRPPQPAPVRPENEMTEVASAAFELIRLLAGNKKSEAGKDSTPRSSHVPIQFS